MGVLQVERGSFTAWVLVTAWLALTAAYAALLPRVFALHAAPGLVLVVESVCAIAVLCALLDMPLGDVPRMVLNTGQRGAAVAMGVYHACTVLALVSSGGAVMSHAALAAGPVLGAAMQAWALPAPTTPVGSAVALSGALALLLPWTRGSALPAVLHVVGGVAKGGVARVCEQEPWGRVERLCVAMHAVAALVGVLVCVGGDALGELRLYAVAPSLLLLAVLGLLRAWTAELLVRECDAGVAARGAVWACGVGGTALLVRVVASGVAPHAAVLWVTATACAALWWWDASETVRSDECHARGETSPLTGGRHAGGGSGVGVTGVVLACAAVAVVLLVAAMSPPPRPLVHAPPFAGGGGGGGLSVVPASVSAAAVARGEGAHKLLPLPELCITIPTVQRANGFEYLHKTLHSLFDCHLTTHIRVHVSTFGDADPGLDAFGEDVVVYHERSSFRDAMVWPRSDVPIEKVRWYTKETIDSLVTLLKCKDAASRGVPVLFLEDDMAASRGFDEEILRFVAQYTSRNWAYASLYSAGFHPGPHTARNVYRYGTGAMLFNPQTFTALMGNVLRTFNQRPFDLLFKHSTKDHPNQFPNYVVSPSLFQHMGCLSSLRNKGDMCSAFQSQTVDDQSLCWEY